MYKEKIVNVATGEETWRDYTEAEIAEVKAEQAQAAQLLALHTEAEAAKSSAITKLAALGLTEDDLKALGL